MKKFCFIAICLSLWACQKLDSKNTSFENIHIVRNGGGQIDFKLFPTEKEGTLSVVISKFNFKDTTLQFTLEKNEPNKAIFAIFEKVIQGYEKLEGESSPSKLPTGTWVSVFAVRQGKEIEITKPELRDSLLVLERLVRERLPME